VACAAHGAAVIREAAIAAAIALVSPKMPTVQRAELAHTFHAVATRHGLDPLDLVAIAWHESDFHAAAVSADGEDFGLMQVRGRYLAACRENNEGELCKTAKAALLDPHTNIRTAGAAIGAMRDLCRKVTGRSSTLPQWLQAYAGLNHPRVRGAWCGRQKVKGQWVGLSARRHRGLREILDCRRSLTLKRPCHRERHGAHVRSKSTPRRSIAGSRKGR